MIDRFSGLLYAFSVVFILLGQYPLWGQIDLMSDLYGEDAGLTVMNSLLLPVSAGTLGKGEVSSHGMHDATDVSLFPANTALFNSNRFAINHLEFLLGLRKEYAGAAFPVRNVGTIGWYTSFFTASDWEFSRNIQELKSTPGVFDYAIGASFARALWGQYLVGGITVSYLESHLADAVARGIAGGFDILSIPEERFRVRLYGNNIGPKVSYVAAQEYLPTRVGLSAEIEPFARNVMFSDKNKFTIGVGTAKIAGEPLRVGVSLEGGIFNIFYPRVSLTHDVGQDIERASARAGIGVRIGQYQANFGIGQQHADLGVIWAASISYEGDTLSAKTAEDFYRSGVKHFRRGRYARAVAYAKRAVALDPNMWEAHTLIARAQAEMRRLEGLEISLVYCGNNQGKYVPAIAEDGTLGGLAREAAVIKNIRSQFPISISINTGNTIRSSSDELKATLTHAYWKHINFDATCVGEEEITFGLNRFNESATVAAGDLLCSNYENRDVANVVSVSHIKKNRYDIAVFNIVASLPDSQALQDVLKNVREKLQSQRVKKANFRVLVVHAGWAQIRKLLSSLPKVDLVIAGSLNQRFESPMAVDSFKVVSAGSGGRYVGNCILQFTESGEVKSFEHRLIPLTETIRSDSTVDEMVRTMAMKIEMKQKGVDEGELISGKLDGVFTFLSNRKGSNTVFLKVLEKQAEFPLTPSTHNCRSPVSSLKAGKIAYILTMHDDTAVNRIATVNLNGSQNQLINITGVISDLTYTPDGKWLYFCAATGTRKNTLLYRVASDGLVARPVVLGRGIESYSVKDVTFSSDGIMAFTSNRPGKWHIYMSSLTGENPLRLANINANHRKPKFSPDGKYLAYFSDRTGFKGKADLWIYNRNTGKQVQLTRNAHVADYCWLSDSRTILFTAGINLTDFNTLDVQTGTMSKFLPKDSIKNYSEISPRLFHYKNDLKILYTRQYEQDGEQDIFMVNEDGTGEVRVVNSPENDWLPVR